MKKILIKLIEIYGKIPGGFHQACRFTPTCSEYSKEAIKTYGLKKGLKLSIKRVLRCHPFGGFGYDPVRKEK